jgi:DNA-directed RNA polymerase subunit RPC12/RpoP
MSFQWYMGIGSGIQSSDSDNTPLNVEVPPQPESHANVCTHSELGKALIQPGQETVGSATLVQADDNLAERPSSACSSDKHEVFICENCGQKLRVPKTQTELKVTCPKCRTKFIHLPTKLTAEKHSSQANSNSGHDATTWYIKADSSVTGPFSTEQLVDMLDLGTVAPATSASRDGQTWDFSAGDCRTQKVQPTSSVHPDNPTSNVQTSDHAWTVDAIVTASAIGFLLVSIFLIAAFGWPLFLKGLLWVVVVVCGLGAIVFALAANDSDTKDKEKSAYWIGTCVSLSIGFFTWIWIPAGAPHSVVSMSEKAKLSLSTKGRRTLEYWNALPTILGRINAQQLKTPQGVVSTLNSTARLIEQLPTVDVDSDAIHCGLLLHGWLRAMAADAQRNNSPALLIEAFARGYQGDLFGPFLDSVHANAALEQRFVEMQNQFKSARAILSSRYGIEFPQSK